MKKLINIIAALLIFPLISFTGCKNNQKSTETSQDTKKTAEPAGEDPVKRGEYLVTFGGCNDCHSPKENGPQGPQVIKERMLSGYPVERPIMQGDPEVLKKGWILFVPDLTSASGPWGVSFAANLTSDQTGIGNWTEENFLRALKEGKYKGIANSRTLLPPMPWQNFQNAKDEDLKAIFAYLKSTPPVSNIVPAAVIAGENNNQAEPKK
jgi:mono/diheme cytochrome c family protein